MSFTPDEIDALAAAVVRHQRAFESPILTLAEAVTYSKHESDSTFYRWCDKWQVKPVSHGRYSRRWLDRGLDREAAQGRRLPTVKQPHSTEKVAA
jgi:hypothetical protein